jgi:hypothetical protein
MKTCIFVVTYAADAWWLDICLASIRKYATGFDGLVVALPFSDDRALAPICSTYGAETQRFDEAPGKGHLTQNLVKCWADLFCHGADVIAHVDSDTVFCEPAAPADYFQDGKPILWRRRYEALFAQTTGIWQDAFRLWQTNVHRALDWHEDWETMVRLPILHRRETYAATRARVEAVHKQSFDSWVLKQQCEIEANGMRKTQPGFGEFNTLGSVALHEFADRYAIMTVPDDVHKMGLPAPWPGAEPWALPPRPKVRQFYSHELRAPGGISQATRDELRRYGLPA